MRQPIAQQTLSRIYGRGRGWAFSQKDFSDLGSRSSIDVALHRLLAKCTIRRAMRGVYYYPKYSKTLKAELPADLDQVAHALARKGGWRIQITGPAALNLLGLSTQVMGRVAYLSDGPHRIYRINERELIFKHTALKEAGFKYRESGMLTQALKSLGPKRIDNKTITRLQKLLDRDMRSKVLKDTKAVSGWIRDIILKICEEDA
jgi:hypothetical protein